MPAAVCRVGKWVNTSIVVRHRLIDVFNCVQGGEEGAKPVINRHCCVTCAQSCLWLCAGLDIGSLKGISVPDRLIYAFIVVQRRTMGQPMALLPHAGSLMPLAVCRVGNWVTQMQDGEPVEMELDAAPEPRAAKEAEQEEEEDTSVIRETQIGKGGQHDCMGSWPCVACDKALCCQGCTKPRGKGCPEDGGHLCRAHLAYQNTSPYWRGNPALCLPVALHTPPGSKRVAQPAPALAPWLAGKLDAGGS